MSSTNCFTIRRAAAAVSGISIAKNDGNDVVCIGGKEFRLDRDERPTTTAGKVVGARIKRVKPTKGTPFTTLATLAGSSVYTLVHAVFGPQAEVGGRPMQCFVGSAGGKVFASSPTEQLVQVPEGESLVLFYPNGSVRKFHRWGASLEESVLAPEAMLNIRMKHANGMLQTASGTMINCILRGMVDLVNLTSQLDRVIGQEVRMKLIREFFLALPESRFGLVKKSLAAALYAVDSALVPMLYKSGVKTVDGSTNVVSINSARERAKREAALTANRAARHAAQPKKGPGGQKSKQASNPETIARRARKQEQRQGGRKAS